MEKDIIKALAKYGITGDDWRSAAPDHRTFLQRYIYSRQAVNLVERYIAKTYDLFTYQPAAELAKSHQEAPQKSDRGDIYACYKGREYRIEVKHIRRAIFASQEQWPYHNRYDGERHAMLGDRSQYDRADPKPYRYYLVSGDYKTALTCRTSDTRQYWYLYNARDSHISDQVNDRDKWSIKVRYMDFINLIN